MFDFLFGPQMDTITRSESEQQLADARASRLSLYQFDSCPYCQYVRRVIKSLAIDIELRDIHKDPQRLSELVQGGGSQTVPCLRIEDDHGQVRWQYESSEIRDYLIAQFGKAHGE